MVLAPTFSPRHWLLVADRASTRDVAEVGATSRLEWSCPPNLERGDIVLLYERGKRDFADQAPGRKEIGWVMRALSEPRPDVEWGYMAWFDVQALKFPLPLTQAKTSASVRNWWVIRGSLQGHGGNFEIPRTVWRALRRHIESRNLALAGVLDVWEKSRPRRLKPEEMIYESWDAEDDPDLDRHFWRSERDMEPVILDLIDQEGWARRIDPDDGVLGRPSVRGFHLAREDWYVDYLLRLGPKHLLVVEFERSAHGDPLHGAKQATEYCRALRRRLRGWCVSGLVIAEDFNEAELKVADDLEIECLEASWNDRRRRPELTPRGRYSGPVQTARLRIARRRAPWRVMRRRGEHLA
jgi:hypothetical protein